MIAEALYQIAHEIRALRKAVQALQPEPCSPTDPTSRPSPRQHANASAPDSTTSRPQA